MKVPWGTITRFVHMSEDYMDASDAFILSLGAPDNVSRKACCSPLPSLEPQALFQDGIVCKRILRQKSPASQTWHSHFLFVLPEEAYPS